MGLYDLNLIKTFPDRPYMNSGESELFKKLRAGGALSVFRVASCEVCKKDIPKPKKYCSKRCYEIWKEQNGEEDEHGEVD